MEARKHRKPYEGYGLRLAEWRGIAIDAMWEGGLVHWERVAAGRLIQYENRCHGLSIRGVAGVVRAAGADSVVPVSEAVELAVSPPATNGDLALAPGAEVTAQVFEAVAQYAVGEVLIGFPEVRRCLTVRPRVLVRLIGINAPRAVNPKRLLLSPVSPVRGPPRTQLLVR